MRLQDGGARIQVWTAKLTVKRRMAFYKFLRMFKPIVDSHGVVGISGSKAKLLIELLALASYG